MASLEIANTSTLVSHASVSEAKLKDGDTQTQPIRTVASLQAQIFRHVHPVLLISFCLISFDALVADPVSTMLNSLPVVVAIQAAYAIVCLPAVGSQVAKPAKKLRPGEKRKPGLEAHTGPNIAVVGFIGLIILVLMVNDITTDDARCSHLVSHCHSRTTCCSCPIWSPPFDSHTSYAPLLNVSGCPWPVPTPIYPWCIRQRLVRNPERASPPRRSIWRLDRCLCGSLAWCCTNSPRLGSRMAEVACDDCVWDLCWLLDWEVTGRHCRLWIEAWLTLDFRLSPEKALDVPCQHLYLALPPYLVVLCTYSAYIT